MRAEVARHYGGTPFDEAYLAMPTERLYILWSEARRHQRKEEERLVQRLKYEDTLARFIGMIANPQAYGEFLKHEKMDVYKDELTPERALEDFDTIKQMGLEFLEAVYPEGPKEKATALDPELEQFFQGDGLEGFRQSISDEPIHTTDLMREIEEEGDE